MSPSRAAGERKGERKGGRERRRFGVYLGAVLIAAGGVSGVTSGQNLIDATYGAGAGSFELGAYSPSGAGFMRIDSPSGVIGG